MLEVLLSSTKSDLHWLHSLQFFDYTSGFLDFFTEGLILEILFMLGLERGTGVDIVKHSGSAHKCAIVLKPKKSIVALGINVERCSFSGQCM